MKLGPIVSLFVGAIAVVGMGFVFVQNASPYLTINKLEDTSKCVHVVGQIVPGSIEQQAGSREVRFKIKDTTGQLNVLYTGPAVSNLSTATQVVVIGSKEAQQFHATQMLVKCPSKYESGKTAKR